LGSRGYLAEQQTIPAALGQHVADGQGLRGVRARMIDGWAKLIS